MRRLVCLAMIVVAAASVIADERILAEVAKGRDLGSYKDGGVYRTEINKDDIADVQRLRQFIMRHWTGKRRAFVRYVFQGTDAGTEHYLFIEPAGDRWRIVWVEDYYSVISGYSPPPPRVHRDIVVVERCRGALIFFDAKDRVVTYL